MNVMFLIHKLTITIDGEHKNNKYVVITAVSASKQMAV